MPAITCGSGTRSTRRSTTPDGAFEEPPEHAAGQVADEAAEHPADAGELRAVGREVLAEHEAGRGEQHHGEESCDLDEHGASLPNPSGIGGWRLRLEPAF